MVDQTYLLFDKINTDSAKEVVDWILQNNSAENPHPYLMLIIDSEGGDVNSAFGIIDMMNLSKIPVRTFGVGEIHSSALMIFIGGEKDSREITPNISILSHRFSAGTDGKYHDLQAMNKEFTMLHEKMVKHYMRCTGLSRNKVEKLLLPHEDIWLSPNEALNFGLCDKISN